jgi:hypothetical protein
MRHTAMSASSNTLAVSDLPKDKLARLRKDAKALGLTPEHYARQLIEDGLALEHRARTRSFDDLFAPAQHTFKSTGMTKADLDAAVDRARSRQRRQSVRRMR